MVNNYNNKNMKKKKTNKKLTLVGSEETFSI